jgi:hypothetical protein
VAKFETIPLLGQSQESRSIRVSNQRTVNMYPSANAPGAKSQLSLFPTNGLTLLSTPNNGPCRSNGVLWMGSLYFVIANKLVKLNSVGAATEVGTLNTSASRCVIAIGRTYIVIVDGTDGYAYDGTTFTVIGDSDADFPAGATHVTYLDGYFIVNEGSTDAYFISAIENPLSWDPLDSSSAQASPDNIVGLVATNKDLYLFGDTSCEVHFNSGNADFPFEAYPGGVLEVGLQAPYSLVRSSFGLLGLLTNDEGDSFVGKINGFQVTPISDDDLNYQINTISTTSDAFGMLFRRQGRTFYALSFPSGDRTWAIEVSSGFVHERKSEGIGRWRVSGVGKIANILVCGDYNTGQVYRLDSSVYTENGSRLDRKRVTQVVHMNHRRMTFHRVCLEMQTGVGLVSGQGSKPQVMMRFSDDGGNEWSDSMMRSFGAIGKYRTEVIWDCLGDSRERIFEFSVTDPVNTVMVAGYAEVTVAD